MAVVDKADSVHVDHSKLKLSLKRAKLQREAYIDERFKKINDINVKKVKVDVRINGLTLEVLG